MYTKNNSSVEVVSIFTLLLGIIGDEFSTYFGISTGLFNESNKIVQNLINLGIWTPFDFITMFLLTSVSYVLSKRLGGTTGNLIMLSPFVVGLIRLFACISNVAMLMNYGYF
jgi:hypothetical protein